MEIKLIRGCGSNCYIVKEKDNWLLVDVGNNSKRLINAIREKGLSFDNLKLIIITHAHSDHVGALKDIVDKTKCKVLIQQGDKEALEKGIKELNEATTAFSKLMKVIVNIFFKRTLRFKPVKADIVIQNELELFEYGFNAKVINTPGHTEGSLSVIVENKKAIVGDILFNIFPGTVITFFTNNKKELLESCERLLNERYETYYVGHGKPLSYDKYEAKFKSITSKLV